MPHTNTRRPPLRKKRQKQQQLIGQGLPPVDNIIERAGVPPDPNIQKLFEVIATFVDNRKQPRTGSSQAKLDRKKAFRDETTADFQGQPSHMEKRFQSLFIDQDDPPIPVPTALQNVSIQHTSPNPDTFRERVTRSLLGPRFVHLIDRKILRPAGKIPLAPSPPGSPEPPGLPLDPEGRSHILEFFGGQKPNDRAQLQLQDIIDNGVLTPQVLLGSLLRN